MSKFVLSWGNTECIRQAFVNVYDGEEFVFDRQKLKKMEYTPHYGNEKLLEITKKVIERQTGKKYPYVILTNGAAGGITIALRAYRQRGLDTVVTNKPPFFPFYPAMFKAAGITQEYIGDKIETRPNVVCLIDSPSNPTGEIGKNISKMGIGMPVILDAVYNNKVYFSHPKSINLMVFDTMVGSYSKLLGLNGIRIGWIATGDAFLYERFKGLVDGEYAGLSAPSMDLLVHVLKGFNWDKFEKEAQKQLNNNREEWTKLERFFEEEPVNDIGMFYYGKIDKSANKLLKKSNIEWLPGDVCHHDASYGRFNLGADCSTVKEAVKTVLKNDRR